MPVLHRALPNTLSTGDRPDPTMVVVIGADPADPPPGPPVPPPCAAASSTGHDVCRDRFTGMVLLGAGDGTRLGRGPKAFLELRGRSLLDWALRSATTNTSVCEIVVMGPPGHGDALRAVVDEVDPRVGITVVDGGATRHDSVRRGLGALSPELPFAAVAEVARPFAPPGIVDTLVARLVDHPSIVGAIPALTPVDTVHEVGPDMSITRVVRRERLALAQTPQVFRAPVVREAYAQAARAGVEGTDDAQVVQQFAAGAIVCVAGSRRNFKITDSVDLERAERDGPTEREAPCSRPRP